MTKEKNDKEKKFGIGLMLDAGAEVLGAEEIVVKEIKPFGKDGAHITGINPDYVGHKAKVIIRKKEENTLSEKTKEETS